MTNDDYGITEQDIANESSLHTLLEYFKGRKRFRVAANKAAECTQSLHDQVQQHLDGLQNPRVLRVIHGAKQHEHTLPETIMGYSYWLVVDSLKPNFEQIEVPPNLTGFNCPRIAHCHPVIPAGRKLATALSVHLDTPVCGVRWWGDWK